MAKKEAEEVKKETIYIIEVDGQVDRQILAASRNEDNALKELEYYLDDEGFDNSEEIVSIVKAQDCYSDFSIDIKLHILQEA